MTEPDLPFVKPGPEIPPETNEHITPSPDVKNPLPNHEPTEKLETEAFICPVCGKPFNNKADLDLHMAKDHGNRKKA
jgi:Zinc finger, C2H2 type.